MKITEDSINHNVTLLIDNYTEVIWEIDEENQDHKRLMTLGYIRGVIEMAGAMKEVLKS